MSFALLHHGGEGKPKRVFAVGLQAPIYALVGEGLLEPPPAGQATLWWDDLVDPVCRVPLGGMGGSPDGQITPHWDGLLGP